MAFALLGWLTWHGLPGNVPAATGASLLFNLSDGLFGVVENGAGGGEGLHPIGTGSFRFVYQVQDKEVVLQRNADYWAGAPSATIQRVRFEVVPDTITAALEMEKGSADVESNVLTPEMVHALRRQLNLQSIAGRARASIISTSMCRTQPCATDAFVRPLHALSIRTRSSHRFGATTRVPPTPFSPPGHWAAASDSDLAQYPNNITRAIQLLNQAGYKPDRWRASAPDHQELDR